MTDIFCQFGNFPADGIDSQACDGSRSIDIQVSIVFTAFRKSGNLIGGDKHKKLFRFYRSELLHQVVSDFVHINKYDSELFRYIAWRIQISSMRIEQDRPFFGLLFFPRCPADILSDRGILRLDEVTADDGIEQYGDAAFRAGFVYITAEIVIECSSRLGVSGRIRFFIIMSELDKDIITVLHFGDDFCPTSFGDKTLGTASVGCMIVYLYVLGEKSGKYHSPATFGISAVQLLVSHSRIPYHKDSYDRLVRAKCRAENKGNCQQQY